MKDMCISSTPAKDEFHGDERKPVRPIPKAKKSNKSDTDGGKTQFHLETAIQWPANAWGNLVGIEQVPHESAHDGKPAWKPNCVYCNKLKHRFFSFPVTGAEQMRAERNDRHRDLDVYVHAWNFK